MPAEGVMPWGEGNEQNPSRCKEVLYEGDEASLIMNMLKYVTHHYKVKFTGCRTVVYVSGNELHPVTAGDGGVKPPGIIYLVSGNIYSGDA